MCDVCTFEKIDSEMLNGGPTDSKPCTFYRTNGHGVSSLKLCRMHDIELFLKGETRFIKCHSAILRRMGVSKTELDL